MTVLHRLLTCAATFILLSGAIAASAAPRIASFDAARGGEGSLSTSSLAAGIRADIATYLPGTTYVSFNSLATLSIANADVVVLNSVFNGAGTSITPLSAIEQTALANFVRAGGAAILLGDNPGFITGTTSFFSPFGFAQTGDGPTVASASLTAVSGGNPLASGAAGNVSAFDVRFFSYLSTPLPTGAVSLAGQAGTPVAAYLPQGIFSAGSGEVFAFSDSLYYNTPAGNAANLAVVNAISAAGVPAVVPEANTFALIGMSVPVVGMISLYRRRKKHG